MEPATMYFPYVCLEDPTLLLRHAQFPGFSVDPVLTIGLSKSILVAVSIKVYDRLVLHISAIVNRHGDRYCN